MKKQTIVRISMEERRAMRMLAGQQDLSLSEWTSGAIADAWEKHFPGMNYPDKDGNIRPKELIKKGK